MAVYFSVSGRPMQGLVLYGNYVVQFMVVSVLIAIHYFARKME